MTPNAKNMRLGLSFGAEDLHLIQAEETAGRLKINFIKDVSASIPFSIDLLSEDSGAEMVGAELRKTFDEHGISAKELALSLDLNLGVIVKIPYENKLSEKDLTTHLKWELLQYVDEDIDNYTFDSYKLIQSPSMKRPELVMVGTRNRVIEFYRNVCHSADVDLAAVNIDVIAAVNAFEANYKFKPNEKIALVEVGERKLVFTLLEGNFFIGHQYIFLDETVQGNFMSTVPDLIAMNLKTLFTDYELGGGSESFDHVFLYRTNTKFDMTQIVGTISDNDAYSVLNPFEKVKIDPGMSAEIDTEKDNSEYVEAVGLALY
ncbi:type IV pilus biogenesis protein PilM [candidate division KSB1 bacterium]